MVFIGKDYVLKIGFWTAQAFKPLQIQMNHRFIYFAPPDDSRSYRIMDRRVAVPQSRRKGLSHARIGKIASQLTEVRSSVGNAVL